MVLSLDLHRSPSLANPYWVNVSIGTPPHPLGLFVDLQYFETYVMVEDSVLAEPCDETIVCPIFGSFDRSKSSSGGMVTLQNEHSTYGYETEVLNIGGKQVDDVPMGFVIIYRYGENLLGLSPDNKTLPFQLVDLGLIRSPSFSMWGNMSEDGQGGIIFGGVNTAKYHSPLQAYALNKTWGDVTLPLDGFQVTTDLDAPINYTMPRRPCLSSRHITTTLPVNMVQQMYEDYGISWQESEDIIPQFGKIACSRRYTENRTISLNFGNTTISAPWSDFFGDSSDGICNFLIKPTSSHELDQIGTIFSHRMYIAVNYNSGFVGVAALDPNPGQDRILEIGTGPRIPDAVGDFPASIVPHSPRTTTTSKPSTSTSILTSTGQAVMPTAPPSYLSGGVLAGVAGAALVAVL